MYKMTYAILFSMLLGTVATAQDKWATLKVKFVVDGKIPEQEKLDTSKDPFCADLDVPNEKILVHGKEQKLQNLVLTMDMRRSGVTAIHPTLKAPPEDKPVLDNKGCVFVPRVLFVRAGQTVQVTNSDSVGHNAAFTSFFNDKNTPVNSQIPAGGSVDVPIAAEEIAPVPVTCGAHPWMKAMLVVQEHPYVGISDKEGMIEIKNLPVGEVAFKVWHESCGRIREMSINGKAERLGRSGWEIELKEGLNDLGTVTLEGSSLGR